jgi:hypothetical protein
MVTGENAGTWGTKTNTNLNIIEQISGGYAIQTLNTAGTGANTTTLAKADGATGATVASRVIILGAVSPQAITGAKIVTMPVLTENFYIIKNSTSGSYTVQLKAASGSGATVTWGTADKGWKVIYFDGVATNTGVYDTGLSDTGTPAGSNTQVQYNSSGAFAGDANLIWDSTGLNIGTSKELRLQDNTGGEYVGQKAANGTTSYTVTLPAAVGATSTALVTTNGSGTLGWTATSTFGITTGKAIAMAMIFG